MPSYLRHTAIVASMLGIAAAIGMSTALYTSQTAVLTRTRAGENTKDTPATPVTRCVQSSWYAPQGWLYGGSKLVSMSRDARYVVFRSDYSNFDGLFLRDLKKKDTKKLPDIGEDVVIDNSGATLYWLTLDGDYGQPVLHVHDIKAKTDTSIAMQTISTVKKTTSSPLSHLPPLAVSDSGRYVFFAWRKDVNAVYGFVYDRKNAALTTTVAQAYTPLSSGTVFIPMSGVRSTSYGLRLRADGRFAYSSFFQTYYTKDGKTEAYTDQTGRVRMKAQNIGRGEVQSISGSGTFLVFSSGPFSNVLFDTTESLAQRISCQDALLSDDASTVICVAVERLDNDDKNDTTDVYSYDRKKKKFTLISLDPKESVGKCPVQKDAKQ